MKSILYVGATLMIGASIYGFVDYKKTSHNKKFSNMYAEKKGVVPEVVTDIKLTEPVIIKGEEKIIDNKNAVVKNSVSKKKKNIIPTKKKRKFNSKMFSRGGLDERYIEPKVKGDVLKEEIKKTEIKEQ